MFERTPAPGLWQPTPLCKWPYLRGGARHARECHSAIESCAAICGLAHGEISGSGLLRCDRDRAGVIAARSRSPRMRQRILAGIEPCRRKTVAAILVADDGHGNVDPFFFPLSKTPSSAYCPTIRTRSGGTGLRPSHCAPPPARRRRQETDARSHCAPRHHDLPTYFVCWRRRGGSDFAAAGGSPRLRGKVSNRNGAISSYGGKQVSIDQRQK